MFALSEVKLGLVPAVISPYVVAAIGARAARRAFISGEVFDAEQALAIGPLYDSVAAEALDDEVERVLYRSEEHTSERQSLMRIQMAVFCLKRKTQTLEEHTYTH